MTSAVKEQRWAANGSAEGGGKGKAATSQDGDGSASGKGKRKIKINLKSKKSIIAIVAVLAVGYGAYSFLMPKPVDKPAPGDVVKVDPQVINLGGSGYLKIGISIQLVKGKASATSFDASHASELTIDEFMGRSAAALTTLKTLDALKSDLVSKIKAAYPGEVWTIYVTQFVSQ